MNNFPVLKKYKKLVFNDFSNNSKESENYSSKLYSNLAYNVNFKTKTIKSGLGISNLIMPVEYDLSEQAPMEYDNMGIEKINNLLYFRQYFPKSGNTQHRILLHGSDGDLYVYQMHIGVNKFMWLDLHFETPPICLTYKLDDKDTILLSSNEKMVVWTTDKSPYEVTDIPVITSMCISNDILFCTIAGEANRIWLCMSSNPELIGSSSEATKSITLDDERGYSRKVLTFKENLYAFRDYGITRINYYSNDNISLKQVYLSDSLIFANTITVCGDVVVFMTRDGIYSFDGVNVKKLQFGIEDKFDNQNSNAVGACLQDKLYLALKINFNDNKKILCENNDYQNNALMVINLNDNSYELFRGVDISGMLPLKTDLVEKMLITFNDENCGKIGEIDDSGMLFGVVPTKFYSTKNLLKDNLNKIVIRKISLISTLGTTFNIITENGNHEFVCNLEGLNEFQTIIECRNFKIELSSQSQDFEVKHLEIEYYKAN